LKSLSWYQQGCVNFCSGMYQSQKFHNPAIFLGPCGTRPLIDSVTNQVYPSCRTIPNKDPVTCSEQEPCPSAQGPAGLLSLDNNCNAPFLCNPVPLNVPIRSPRSIVGKQSSEDWSRAYCQESPRINLGSGQWRYEKATPLYAWNPFMNNFGPSSSSGIHDIPAYVDTTTYEYGMISCTLFCTTPETCPYSKDNPKFNPELRRVQQHVPMDYISPATLQAIQDSKSVKCVKIGGNYKPPQGKDFCFVCTSEDLELTVPVIGVDNFNEIVFTTAFGPSVAALWTILIFEHLVFIIKFFVMALVCGPPLRCILHNTLFSI
jgi:hypothetical protein